MTEEWDKILKENDRLMSIQSDNVTIHREVTKKLDNDLQSMIVNCKELHDQLRENKLQNRLNREEFERLLKSANQHSYSNETGRQLVNSIELPCHDHVCTIR